MGNSDRLLGGLMLLSSATIFFYYTVWTLATPFFPPDAIIHQYFLDPQWAVRIPAAVLLFFMAAIGTLISLALIKQDRMERLKKC